MILARGGKSCPDTRPTRHTTIKGTYLSVWPSLDWPGRSKDRPLHMLTAANPFWREARAEFAGGEGIQAAEAGGKLDLGQAALAMQPPEEISRGEIVFLAVALVTAGNQVAPGIIPELCKRDDVIQAAGCASNAAQTIETAAAFSGMNSAAQRRMFQKVQIVEIEGASMA